MAIDSVVIGFGYRARSGKDTAVAEIIAKRGIMHPTGTFVQGSPDGMYLGTGTGVAGYDIRRYAFADALKREVTAAALSAGGMNNLFCTEYFVQTNNNFIPLPVWVREGYEPNPDMTDPQCPFGKQRALLQWWGTEYRRSIDPDYWVRQLAKRIEDEKPQFALITDMRFPNEMEFANEYGETVRVDRDGLPPSTHASETALADATDWSLILDNNGTLEEFKEGAVLAFDELITNFP